MSEPRKGSLSVAKALSPSEASDLVALAVSLPDSWCVQILPPDGQLAIGPLSDRPTHHRCWTAAVAWGAIRRESCIGGALTVVP